MEKLENMLFDYTIISGATIEMWREEQWGTPFEIEYIEYLLKNHKKIERKLKLEKINGE